MELDIGKPILARNDEIAAENRKRLDAAGVFVVNVMASPGSGKTSTILATAAMLAPRFSFAVIEGDIASKVDSEKVKAAGIPCVQINTGGICHLESQMVAAALDKLDLASIDAIFIENVGNLVCPTDFYLGENMSVVVLSVPEGHDKPVKYPGIFQAASAILLNKIDTMEVFDFDEDEFRSSLAGINPTAPVFAISARRGDGVQDWCSWLESSIARFGGAR